MFAPSIVGILSRFCVVCPVFQFMSVAIYECLFFEIQLVYIFCCFAMFMKLVCFNGFLFHLLFLFVVQFGVVCTDGFELFTFNCILSFVLSLYVLMRHVLIRILILYYMDVMYFGFLLFHFLCMLASLLLGLLTRL